MSEHDGLHAELVWDGGDIHIPAAMGTPKTDQMQGGPVEKVSELSCRICYDSLGAVKSRGTQANLDHVKEVKHYSVLAHHHWPIEFTFTSMGERDRCVLACLNRPGIWVRRGNGTTLRLTLNPRALLEWDEWTKHLSEDDSEYETRWARWLGRAALRLWCIKAPMLFGEFPVLDEKGETVDNSMRQAGIRSARWAEPVGKHESWVSIYMRGSRGFSHEQVRHGMFTAVSQRSTRYVDESSSPWIQHPLVVAYLESLPLGERDLLERQIAASETAGKATYDSLIDKLQPWLKARGVDTFTARKQARGAARGYLGNALQTELIFSASVFEWLHVLDMRCADAADAEIRLIYNLVLPILKASRYGHFFSHLSMAPASDGLGQALVGGGAR